MQVTEEADPTSVVVKQGEGVVLVKRSHGRNLDRHPRLDALEHLDRSVDVLGREIDRQRLGELTRKDKAATLKEG